MQLIHHHFKSINSTNTWAKQHAVNFDPQAITLVTADEQTQGRGRLGRSWVSPAKKNVYATYCIFFDRDRKDISNLPQVAALTVMQVLSLFGVVSQLKWPNDLFVNHKKIGGLLSEAVIVANQRCLLIGIGLNIDMQAEELGAISKPATSLSLEAQAAVEVKHVLSLLSQHLLVNICLFLKEGFHLFLEPLRQRLYQPAFPISFHDNQQLHRGTIASLNADGSLALLLEDGSTRVFYAGEII